MTISPARIKPATLGTKATLPGAIRPAVPFVSSASPWGKSLASSVDHTAFTPVTFRFFSSRRMTRARGHTLDCSSGPTWKAVGSSLFPAPMQLITGTPASRQRRISSILELTVSMASAT